MTLKSSFAHLKIHWHFNPTYGVVTLCSLCHLLCFTVQRSCHWLTLLALVPQNERGYCPADVVPDPLDMPLEMADGAAVAKELRTLLRRALPRPSSPLPFTLHAQGPPALSEKAKVQLAGMGVGIGDCVVIAGQKVCYRSPLGVRRAGYLSYSHSSVSVWQTHPGPVPRSSCTNGNSICISLDLQVPLLVRVYCDKHA